ncbi:hypothetical protein [Methylosinus sp. sav-2]|nr:hypothetical protein [Methylosinus sp. sav-2]
MALMTSMDQFDLRTQSINLKRFFRLLVFAEPLCPFADSRGPFAAC